MNRLARVSDALNNLFCISLPHHSLFAPLVVFEVPHTPGILSADWIKLLWFSHKCQPSPFSLVFTTFMSIFLHSQPSAFRSYNTGTHHSFIPFRSTNRKCECKAPNLKVPLVVETLVASQVMIPRSRHSMTPWLMPRISSPSFLPRSSPLIMTYLQPTGAVGSWQELCLRYIFLPVFSYDHTFQDTLILHLVVEKFAPGNMSLAKFAPCKVDGK